MPGVTSRRAAQTGAFQQLVGMLGRRRRQGTRRFVGPFLMWLVLLASTQAVSCNSKPSGTTANGARDSGGASNGANAKESLRPLPLMVNGCERLQRPDPLNGRCEASRAVAFWLASGGEDATLFFNDAARPGDAVEGGVQVIVPAVELPVSVEVRGPDGRVFERLSIIRAPTRPPLQAIQDQVKAGALEDALASALTLADGDDEDLALLGGVTAVRILVGKGALEEAKALALRLLKRGASSSLHRAMSDLATIAVHAMTTLGNGRFDIEAVLDTVRARGGVDAYAAVNAEFYAGSVAMSFSNPRRAMARFKTAVEEAERVGQRSFADAARAERLYLAAMVGEREMFEASHAAVSAAIPSEGNSPCNRVSSWSNLAWARLVLEESMDTPSYDRAIEDLTRALSHFEGEERCDDVKVRVDTGLNLAYAQLRAGRTAEAEQTLRQVGPSQTDLQDQWRRLLQAWIAGRKGALDLARSQLLAIAEEAERGGSFDLAWRAAVEGADLSAGGGDLEGSLRFHAVADRILSLQVWTVAADSSRELFVGARRAVAQRHVQRLIAAGRVGDAWCTYRIARTQALRTFLVERRGATDGANIGGRGEAATAVAQWRRRRAEIEASRQRDWTRSSAELAVERSVRARASSSLRADLDGLLARLENPAGESGGANVNACSSLAQPRADEVWLGLMPVGAEGGLMFVATEKEVRTGAVILDSLGSPPVSSDDWSTFVHAALEAASSVHVVASGRMNVVDVHAMERNGSPLLATHAVVYHLDLPTSRVFGGVNEARTGRDSQRSALVVSDPQRNLKAAREEGGRVSESLRSRAWEIEYLEGKDASAAAVLAAIGRAEWFHFAGHATQTSIGWGGELALSRGQRISAVDLFMLPQVPRVAVLAACEAGGMRSDGMSGGLTLATALLLRGSEAVVAPLEKVSDAVSGRFVKQLYAALESGASMDRAFSRAALQTQVGGGSSWRPYRLWRP